MFTASIIILNYNRGNDTITLLNYLLNNNLNNINIIVIDNNSEKDDQNLLNSYFSILNRTAIQTTILNYKSIKINSNLIYIKLDKNYGYSKANNFGLKIVENNEIKYAFILNSDITINNKDIFNDFIKQLEKNNKLAIIGPYVVDNENSQQGPFPRPFSWFEIFYKIFYPVLLFPRHFYALVNQKIQNIIWGYVKVYCVIGCFWGINIQLLKNVNYLDENTFLYCEEQILAERLRKYGYIVGFNKNHKIFHNHKISEKYLIDNNYINSYDYYINSYIKPNKYKVYITKIVNHYYNITIEKIKSALGLRGIHN